MTIRIESTGSAIIISKASFIDMVKCIDYDKVANRNDVELLQRFAKAPFVRDDRVEQAFSVELSGSFHTFKLLDSNGQNLTNMMAAAKFAEDEFQGDWDSVFNGEESIERETWIDCLDSGGL